MEKEESPIKAAFRVWKETRNANKRRKILLNSNLGAYIQEIIQRVGNKRVEVLIRKPDGTEIHFKPSEAPTSSFTIGNEEIY